MAYYRKIKKTNKKFCRAKGNSPHVSYNSISSSYNDRVPYRLQIYEAHTGESMELGLILIPFVLAVLISLAGRSLPRSWLHWGCAAIMLGRFVWVLSLLQRIHAVDAVMLISTF